MTKDIYTAKELKTVREVLFKEQEGKDAITGICIPFEKSVCDHRHDSECLVRGVLHRSCNSALGRIENTFLRDLSWWYPLTISDFLRQAADYLENTTDSRYRHNSFIKRLKTDFNKLNANQQKDVLKIFGVVEGGNINFRKKLFNEVVLDRENGFCYIRDVINQVKEK